MGRKRKGDPHTLMKGRAVTAACLLVLFGFGSVTCSLYRVQITEGKSYGKIAFDQQLSEEEVRPRRGSIYSSDRKTLAFSKTSWRVLYSPGDLRDGQDLLLADGLSELIGADREKVLERCANRKSRYQVAGTGIDRKTADAVLDYAETKGIGGVWLEEDSTRVYPMGSLASTVLGFVNAEEAGAYGLEAYYNDDLSGTPGRRVTARNAVGASMPFVFQDITSAADGNHLVTTIDTAVQTVCERHLATAIAEHAVQNRASVLVMDVNSGAVLAMSTMPDYDPNHPRTVTSPISLRKLRTQREGSGSHQETLRNEQLLQWNNKCVNEVYEPGSVFKVITTAIGLETGAVTPYSVFSCDGTFTAGGRIRHCWKLSGHGTENLAEAMQNSCNPAYMRIGQLIGGDAFYGYARNFGFLEPTGIDLPGEETGVFHSAEELCGTGGDLETTAFGQSFKVTPIQLLTAVSAAVNGGRLYRPYLVDRILNPDGSVLSVTEPRMRRQVISAETSETVAALMAGVVEKGSGVYAQVPGYRIGGKTGTAEKLDSDRGYYAYSFVGVAPADHPEVAVLLILDEPYETDLYGSQVAAPVVGGILSEILPYLGVGPRFTDSERLVREVTVPAAVGLSAHMGMAEMTRRQLRGVIRGHGGAVERQIPEAGVSLPKGGFVMLYTDAASRNETVPVPDAVGKPLRAVRTTAEELGLNLSVGGSADGGEATVVRQSPAPGEKALPGTVLTVDCGEP